MSLEASLHTSAVRTGGLQGNAVPASLSLPSASSVSAHFPGFIALHVGKLEWRSNAIIH